MNLVFSLLSIFVLSVSILLGLPTATKVAEKTFNSFTLAKVPDNSVQKKFLPNQILGAETAKVLPKSQNINPPILTATSAMVKDLDNDFVFFVKDSDKRVPIASTTKIMTSIIASEYFKQNEILVVPEVASVSGSTMGLKTGEKLTFRSLIYGLMLNSGNDAAFTIAASYPGGVNAFVDAMNNKALSLGLVNTHFDNPAGFDSPNHYSSAADLAKIAAIAAENPQLARVFVTKETSVTSIDRANVHQLKNLNKLLDLPGVLGIKTGFTPAAKENFVGLIERDNHRILTVVLGSDDRFGETQKLMDWVFANFIWE